MVTSDRARAGRCGPYVPDRDWEEKEGRDAVFMKKDASSQIRKSAGLRSNLSLKRKRKEKSTDELTYSNAAISFLYDSISD